MGYSTEFDGAFKVTPMVETETAMRLDLWLNSRHYIRKFPKESELMDRTIFGSAGEKGQYIMPSLFKAKEQLIQKGINPEIVPWMLCHHETEDDIVQECSQDNTKEIMEVYADITKRYNTTPVSIPSLWSNFFIVQDPDRQCSWVMWDSSEKSHQMQAWGEFLWWLLLEMGYTMEGTINARGEDPTDLWHMTASKQAFLTFRGFGHETYAKEANDAIEKSRKAAQITN